MSTVESMVFSTNPCMNLNVLHHGKHKGLHFILLASQLSTHTSSHEAGFDRTDSCFLLISYAIAIRTTH
jgi:hypothetical protein